MEADKDLVSVNLETSWVCGYQFITYSLTCACYKMNIHTKMEK